MQPISAAAIYLLLGAFIGWRIYARFQRMVGRQRLSKYRAPVTLAIFPALVILAAMSLRAHPAGLLWLAVGLSCGVVLGVFGLARTKFEAIPGQGLFYTPNAHLGIALCLLFVARLAYRLFEVKVLAPAAPHSAAEFVQSPLTLAAFSLLAGYYIRYAIGLHRWRARVFRAKKARESARSEAAQ